MLARMESDDAADLLGELPRSGASRSSTLLPAVQRRRVRALLGYDPATAGGLMSPDFVCVYAQATRRGGARARRARSPIAGGRARAGSS